MNERFSNTPIEILQRSASSSVFFTVYSLVFIMFLPAQYWIIGLPIYCFFFLIQVVLNNQVIEVNSDEIIFMRFNYIYKRIPVNSRTIDFQYKNKTIPVFFLIQYNHIVITNDDYSTKRFIVRLSDSNYNKFAKSILSLRDRSNFIDPRFSPKEEPVISGKPTETTTYTTNINEVKKRNKKLLSYFWMFYFGMLPLFILSAVLTQGDDIFKTIGVYIIMYWILSLTFLLALSPLFLNKKFAHRKIPATITVSNEKLIIDGVEFQCNQINYLQLSSPSVPTPNNRVMSFEYENKSYTFYFGTSYQKKLFKEYTEMCNQLSSIFEYKCEFKNRYVR